MDRGIANDAAWQRRWRRLADQSASWYATPFCAVGHRLTAILDAGWQRFLGRSWNSERTLVFSHVVLTKTLGIRRACDIRGRITRRMDLWERCLQAGFVGDSEVEGADQEVRAASGREEVEKLCPGVTMTRYFLVRFSRLSVGPQTGRGEDVSSRTTNAQKLGNQLQSYSGRNTPTRLSLPWKIPHAQPSRSMRKYQKRNPSTSQRMM